MTLHRNLHDAPRAGRGNLAESRRACENRTWVTEIRAIQGIEDIPTELENFSLAPYPEFLVKHEIECHESGTDENITPRAAVGPRQVLLELRDIEVLPQLGGFRPVRWKAWNTKQVRPILIIPG